ncbi:heparin lyase I family protein [Mycolicibacterium agri]|nr:heparin lyase I family protein [Mycolicibacterium agri]
MRQDRLMFRTGRRSALTMPHPDVFRFELRSNDFGWWADSEDKKRRSEIITANNTTVGAGDGDTIWTAFCVVLGDHPGLLNSQGGVAFPFGFITQWHSVDTTVGRGPVLAVNVSNNALKIQTRSDTGGPSVVNQHYSGAVPAKGDKTYIVMQATFGEVGHLNAWINGSQLVNADTPIGYYNDPHAILGYPHWGLYAINQPTTDIVYIANPEWGTTDLSARISSPLPVPDLTW